MEACTAFHDPSSAHPRLLRSAKDAKGMAVFKVERIEQQGLPKPKASPVIKKGAKGSKRGGGGKGGGGR